MNNTNEILQAAYAEGSKQALLDAGYDEKIAADLSEELIKEAVSASLARRALETGIVSRALNPRTLRGGEKGVRSVRKAKRTIERASSTMPKRRKENALRHLRRTTGERAKETARTIRKTPKELGLSKKQLLEETRRFHKDPSAYKGPLKKLVTKRR